MKGKKISCIILCMALCLALSSCSRNGKNGQNYDDAANELSISIFDRGNVPASEGSYEDNRWSQFIEQETGIKITWVPVPRARSREALNTRFAAGTAPDLVVEFDRNFFVQLYNQGVLASVDGFIKDYSTEYKQYLEDNADLKQYVTFSDGKMYALTNRRAHVATRGVWVRKDWLDKLGLSMPTTNEELLDVLRVIVNSDPDGNGKKDTEGIVFNSNSAPFVFQDMFTCRDWYVEGDTVVNSRLTDRYEAYLTFVKTLYDEGLMYREYITDKTCQAQDQVWTSGNAAITWGAWGIGSSKYPSLVANIPSADIMPMEMVSTQFGRNGHFQDPPAQRYIALNNDIKNPKAAIKLLDWYLSDGWFPLTYGIEGEHYQLNDGVPVIIDKEKNKNELDYNIDYVLLTKATSNPTWFTKKYPADPFNQKLGYLEGLALETALKHTYRRDLPYTPDINEIVMFNAEFDPILEEITETVISKGAAMSPAQGMEKIRSEWVRLGGERIEQLYQQWYDENKSQFISKTE